MKWFYGWLIFFAVVLIATVTESQLQSLQMLGFVGLLIWYFTTAKKQVRYVKDTYGKRYPRKSWTKALLAGVGCIVIYLIAVASLPAFAEGLLSGNRKDAIAAAEQVLRDDTMWMVLEAKEGMEVLSTEVIAEDDPYYQIAFEVGKPGGDQSENFAMCVALQMRNNGEYFYSGPGPCGNLESIREGEIATIGLLLAQRQNIRWPGVDSDVADWQRKIINSHMDEADTNTSDEVERAAEDMEELVSDRNEGVRPISAEDSIIGGGADRGSSIAGTDNVTNLSNEQLAEENAKRAAELEALQAEQARQEQIRAEALAAERRSKLAELQGQLAAVDSKIASEKKRWTDANDIVNKLTNFKKRTVQEGTRAGNTCIEALRVMKEVEDGAPALKAEKARLETMINSLE